MEFRQLKQKITRDIIYIFVVFFLFIVRFIPYHFFVNLGGKFSKFFFKFSKDSNQIFENLKIAFPDKTEEDLIILKDKASEHLGKLLFEFIGLNRLSKKIFFDMFEIKGQENLDKALKEGKGVILLTAHIGNWELLGGYLAMIGYPINVVAKKIYDERLNDILVKLRKNKKVKTLLRTESTKKIIKVLKEKECLGILIDQDTDVKGVFVDFFGRETFTPTGAATLALTYDSVVLPVFTNRLKNCKHFIQIYEKIELKKTDVFEDDVATNTQIFTKIIENQIKKCPEEWVWVHKRWKTKKI